MKTFGRIEWVYVMTVVAVLMFASCGNSQTKKVDSGKQEPTGVVIQESEVVVEIDSIAPDSTAQPKK